MSVKDAYISVKKFVRRHSQKRSAAERVIYFFVFILFAAIAATYLYCMIWCFLQGLKTHNDAVMYPFALPETWNFGNYAEVFSLMNVNGVSFFGMLMNSLYFSVLGGLGTVMGSTMLAYVTTKYRFPGSGLFFVASLVMIILPIYGSGGSAYLLYDALGFINSPLMLIAASAGSA